MMENGQGTGAKLGLPPLTPEQQEALQRVIVLYCFVLPFIFVGDKRGVGISTGHGPNSNLHHLLQCVKSLHTTTVPQLHLIIDS